MNRKSSPLLLAVAVLTAACATPRSATQSSAGQEKAAGANAGAGSGAAIPPTEVTEASLRTNGAGPFELRADIKNVQFDFDSAKLAADALAVLKANADAIKAGAGLQFLVAGHCDERGTVAYNLALGQKRAKAVRDYYIQLGVDGKQIATISYGKEKPLCTESTEDCWAQNRRAETRVRAKAGTAAAAVQAPKPTQ